MHDLVDQWRHGGSSIDDVSHRREAFNIMLSMPNGTSPQMVKSAACEFAQAELAGHRWVMLLHEHQARNIGSDVKASIAYELSRREALTAWAMPGLQV